MNRILVVPWSGESPEERAELLRKIDALLNDNQKGNDNGKT